MKRTIISLLCLAALLCAAIYFYYRNPAAELPPEDGGGPALAKPVIYLYPEEETEATICLIWEPCVEWGCLWGCSILLRQSAALSCRQQ